MTVSVYASFAGCICVSDANMLLQEQVQQLSDELANAREKQTELQREASMVKVNMESNIGNLHLRLKEVCMFCHNVARTTATRATH